MTLQLGETVMDPVEGTLERRLMDKEAWLDGDGTLNEPPLGRPVLLPVLLLSESDPAALRALTAAANTVIN